MQKFINIMAGVLLTVGLVSCSSANSAEDTDSMADKGQQQMVYNASRAAELCNLYNSGMLTDSHYGEMLDMVDVAFDVWYMRQDSLLNNSDKIEALMNGSVEVQAKYQQQYANVNFLMTILSEADTTQLKGENLQRWQKLKLKFADKMDELDRKEKEKFYPTFNKQEAPQMSE